MEPSIFTKIINGELPAHRIYEDDRVIAFLANEPVCDGHILVVPKNEVDQIWNMTSDEYSYLWSVVQKVGKQIKKIYKSPNVGVIVEGFNVPHVHVHLFPIYRRGDCHNLSQKRYVSHEELASTAAMLKM